MYTLVVIDMQKDFVSCNEPNVIRACQREIKLAIRRKTGIIFLEYEGYGHTIPELTNLTTNYDKTYFSSKATNSGSDEVFGIINTRNLYQNVRVVGVNTSYCVYETVEGLKDGLGKITVVADACNCHSHRYGLNKIAELDHGKNWRGQDLTLNKIKIINLHLDNKNKVDVRFPSW